ncbi:MAG TPA: hypothetical protein VFM72_06475, partial [Aequorivita sp.]|nr:hypothetical protein [Aequorivita sp.]
MDQQQIQKNKSEIEAAKEELLASTIFDRTKNIQDNGDNIFKVFEINLRNWFFLNLPYSDDEKLPVALLLQDIQDNWRNCFLYYEEQPRLSVADFVQNELDQLETVDINTPQLKEYEEFLATHFLRYANTDKLMRRISVSNYDYPSLAVFVKGKINPGELDIEKLDQSQKRLLWYMDYIFVHELAHFNYP